MTTESNYVAGLALQWARVDSLEQWGNATPEGGTTPRTETIGEYHSPFPRVEVLRREGQGWEPATVITRTAVDEWTVGFNDGEQVWRDHHELQPDSSQGG